MYTWVYVSELVAIQAMVEVARVERYLPPRSACEVRERFSCLKGRVDDPQHQISIELLDVFLPAAVFLAAAGEDEAEYCELGSTFFVSIEKLEICSHLLGLPFDRAKMLFSGIEYSPFLTRVATKFHPNDPIRIVKEPALWKRSRPNAFHVSRFVGCYAFRSTEAFADEIARCDAFHIIDAFNSGDEDFHSWDLGLPITFLNLPSMVDRLIHAGFDVFLTKADPEYHAAGRKRTMVVRLFGIKKEAAARLDYYQRFDALGGFASMTDARGIDRGQGDDVVSEINSSLTEDQWEAFAEYKRFFPIWGGPPGLTKNGVAELVSSADLHMDLEFDTGQTSAVVRNALRSGAWSPK
jgi:hypothetical protein